MVSIGKAQGIIWDLDGTLLDSFGLYVEILKSVLTARGIELPPLTTLEHNFHGTLQTSISNSLEGLNNQEIKAIVADFLTEQDPHYASLDGHVFNDAEDLLKRAHDSQKFQAIITNRSHKERGKASPRSLIKQVPLKGRINYIVCGDDSDFIKPDKRVVNVVLSESGLDAGQLIIVGDQYVDAELAKNLGVRCILVSRSGKPIPHLDNLENWPDYVSIVTSLREVEV